MCVEPRVPDFSTSWLSKTCGQACVRRLLLSTCVVRVMIREAAVTDRTLNRTMGYSRLAYDFLVLVLGCTLGFQGVPAFGVVFVVVPLLVMPAIIDQRVSRTSIAELSVLGLLVDAAHAAIFAMASYGIGRAVAWLW